MVGPGLDPKSPDSGSLSQNEMPSKSMSSFSHFSFCLSKSLYRVSTQLAAPSFIIKKPENGVILSLGLGYPLGRRPLWLFPSGVEVGFNNLLRGAPDTGLLSVITTEVQVHGTRYPMIAAPQTYVTHQMWNPDVGIPSMSACRTAKLGP